MKKRGFLIDMDGVIYRGSEILPGGKELIEYLKNNDYPFLFLTNNSKPTPKDIKLKLSKMGIYVSESNICTSAMATADFLASQKPEGTAYVLGEGGLLQSLYENGIAINDCDPDFVVVGEGRTLTLEMVERAIDMIIAGSKLIATNLDPAPRVKGWTKPGTGAIIAMLEEATTTKAFSVGKPSPIMMRYARKKIGLQTDECTMVGDTMETDIIGGVSMGYCTILTLTGNTSNEDLKKYPYRPYIVVDNVGKIIDVIEEDLHGVN
jgi:NagD protein